MHHNEKVYFKYNVFSLNYFNNTKMYKDLYYLAFYNTQIFKTDWLTAGDPTEKYAKQI